MERIIQSKVTRLQFRLLYWSYYNVVSDGFLKVKISAANQETQPNQLGDKILVKGSETCITGLAV